MSNIISDFIIRSFRESSATLNILLYFRGSFARNSGARNIYLGVEQSYLWEQCEAWESYHQAQKDTEIRAFDHNNTTSNSDKHLKFEWQNRCILKRIKSVKR
jgi:hypothetical protein